MLPLLSLALSSTQVLLSLLSLFGLAAATTMLIKFYFRAQEQELKEGELALDNSSLTRKHNSLHFSEYKGGVQLLSFCIAIASVLSIMAWTTVTEEHYGEVKVEDFEEEDFILDIPNTITEPPRKSPPKVELKQLPPPPVINPLEFKAVDEEVKVEDKKEEVNPEVVSTTPQEYKGPTQKGNPSVLLPPVQPPVPVQEVEEKPLIFAERMPHLATCADIVDNHSARKQCADAQLMQYINKQIRYPQMAMDAGCQGTAIVSFVVGKKGELEDLQILKDPGCGLGKEALRVVKQLRKNKKWIAGKQNGRPVKVRMNLPVRFRLR